MFYALLFHNKSFKGDKNVVSKKPYLLILLLLAIIPLSALVPPHPRYQQIPTAWAADRDELAISSDPAKTRQLPNNILVLRVQFSDLTFISEPRYPDFLAHDEVFFQRWMLHLSDFFADASHYQYELNHHLYPQVITLPYPIAYYGADSSEKIDARIGQFAQDVIDSIDDVVDFTQYGGLIIFHAGAGQESDIEARRKDEIWSTFLTRKALQAAFDPENDDYPGLETNDGAILTNIVIVAEHEYQDYFPGEGEEDAEAYLFSIYGVLTHQFGHVLGLPTLFDNDSSNGVSQGIGNWGLMGTGVWNASGYVPAQLSAWSRMLLGWEDPILINQDAQDLTVYHFLDHEPDHPRLYKIPISATEYFLIENRQQNPDGSLDPYSNWPSYSFKLIGDEQDYYENYPLLPYFNFMKNRYAGCEWDFFLPGLGGPIPHGQAMPQDGSGLLIWHIDEQIIAQNFTSNFDRNRINAFAHHKGVDLEEADGIQHLDTAIYDIYKWGSPYDAFRQGNNDYFGEAIHNGLMSLPTAESYYGGVPLEIYDIGPCGNQMSFSVRFAWRLETGFTGDSPLNAAIIDIDGDGNDEIVYALPNGMIYAWKDEVLMPGFPKNRQPIPHLFTWDGQHLYIPMQHQTLARLYKMDATGGVYVYTQNGIEWASHPVDAGSQIYMPMRAGGKGKILAYDKQSASTTLIADLGEDLVSNLVWQNHQLSFLSHSSEDYYRLWTYDEASAEISSKLIDVPADSTVVAIFKAPFVPGSKSQNLIIQCAKSIYILDMAGNLIPGFPFIHDSVCTAPLTMADFDQNGTLDLILGCENGVIVIDYSGQRTSPKVVAGPSSEEGGFSAGAIVYDIDGDGQPEILGSFANNQLKVYDTSFRLKKGYPTSFAERSRNLPIIAKASDGNVYILCANDNGKVFRKQITGDIPASDSRLWLFEYANLNRSASFDPGSLQNIFQSNSLFVDGELYLFPNPLKSIYENTITLNVMTTQDTPLDLKIYDIGGKLVYSQKSYAKAYLRNREAIQIPAHKLASGVYIAAIKAGNQTRRLKFAVEK